MSSPSTSPSKPRTHVTLTLKMKARCSGMAAALAGMKGNLHLAGKEVTPAELLAQGEAYLEELTDVDDTKAVWRSKVAKATEDRPKILQFLDDSEQVMKQLLGPTSAALEAMDIKQKQPRKPRKPSATRAIRSALIRQNHANLKTQNAAAKTVTGQALVDLKSNTVLELRPVSSSAAAGPETAGGSSSNPEPSVAVVTPTGGTSVTLTSPAALVPETS